EVAASTDLFSTRKTGAKNGDAPQFRFAAMMGFASRSRAMFLLKSMPRQTGSFSGSFWPRAALEKAISYLNSIPALETSLSHLQNAHRKPSRLKLIVSPAGAANARG